MLNWADGSSENLLSSLSGSEHQWLITDLLGNREAFGMELDRGLLPELLVYLQPDFVLSLVTREFPRVLG